MTSASTATVAQDAPALPPVKTDGANLADGLRGHSNSFGILRLVLASAVVFSHAFYLGGWGEDPLLSVVQRQESIGGLAVLGFFAISGYLITKSGANADWLQFIWRRVLRIFPAFWLVLLVAAFVVGPIAWAFIERRDLADYYQWGPGSPWAYLIANWNLSIGQWGIWDIFATTTPYGPALNGSLWTLTYEWGSYLIIWVLVIFGVLKRAAIVVPILTAFYVILEIAHKVVPGSAAQIVPYFGDHYRISLPLIFLYGACLALYSRKIPLDWRFALLATLMVLASLRFGGLTVIGYPAIAYLVMWLAAALPASLHWIGAKNDYSYGMYVYGFLVQQFTAALGWYRWGYVPWVAVTLVITFGCAWLSWHLVEKRALQLKDVGPGKGLQHWSERIGTRLRSVRRRSQPATAAPAPVLDAE